jgi:hypothetical protein
MYFVGKTLEVRFFYSSKIPASGSGNGYFIVHFPVEKNGPYLSPCVALRISVQVGLPEGIIAFQIGVFWNSFPLWIRAGIME